MANRRAAVEPPVSKFSPSSSPGGSSPQYPEQSHFSPWSSSFGSPGDAGSSRPPHPFSPLDAVVNPCYDPQPRKAAPQTGQLPLRVPDANLSDTVRFFDDPNRPSRRHAPKPPTIVVPATSWGAQRGGPVAVRGTPPHAPGGSSSLPARKVNERRRLKAIRKGIIPPDSSFQSPGESADDRQAGRPPHQSSDLSPSGFLTPVPQFSPFTPSFLFKSSSPPVPRSRSS